MIDNRFTSPDTGQVIGLDNDGNVYLADGSGGFTVGAGGAIGSGAGTTETAYAELALATGGAAWDLRRLRSGGNDALSFASAFIDIMVAEIVSQPPSTIPPIPLPAGLPPLPGRLGMLGVLRARRGRAAA